MNNPKELYKTKAIPEPTKYLTTRRRVVSLVYPSFTTIRVTCGKESVIPCHTLDLDALRFARVPKDLGPAERRDAPKNTTQKSVLLEAASPNFLLLENTSTRTQKTKAPLGTAASRAF